MRTVTANERINHIVERALGSFTFNIKQNMYMHEKTVDEAQESRSNWRFIIFAPMGDRETSESTAATNIKMKVNYSQTIIE